MVAGSARQRLSKEATLTAPSAGALRRGPPSRVAGAVSTSAADAGPLPGRDFLPHGLAREAAPRAPPAGRQTQPAPRAPARRRGRPGIAHPSVRTESPEGRTVKAEQSPSRV